MIVDIDVVRTVDCASLLSALEAEGLRGSLIEEHEQVLVRVDDAETDPQRLQADVLSTIDAWVIGQDLPLLVTPLAEGCYCVHPPGD